MDFRVLKERGDCVGVVPSVLKRPFGRLGEVEVSHGVVGEMVEEDLRAEVKSELRQCER